MENYMMNNSNVGDRLSAMQRNMTEQRSDFIQAETGLDTLKYGGEESATGAIDSSGLSAGLGGSVFDKSVSKIKNFVLKRGKQALIDRVQPEIDKIKQSKADGTLGQQTDAGTSQPQVEEPTASSGIGTQAEDELFRNLPSTQAEAQQKLDDMGKQSGSPDTLDDDGADFSTPRSLGGTQTTFQTSNLDAPSANLSQADTTLTEGIEGDATRGSQILRSFRSTAGGDSGQNIGNSFMETRQTNLFSQQTTTIQPRPAPAIAQPDPVPDIQATPLRPSISQPETAELNTELESTKNALSDRAMGILKSAGIDTGDLSAEELASGLSDKASSMFGEAGSSILSRVGGFLGDALDVLGPIGEVAGIGMSIYGAIKGSDEANEEANSKNQLAQVASHINDMGGISMGSMSLAPMDTESFRSGGSEGNF